MNVEVVYQVIMNSSHPRTWLLLRYNVGGPSPRSSNKGSIQEAMLFMLLVHFPKESMEEKKDEVDVMC